jgi:hypothetical protein
VDADGCRGRRVGDDVAAADEWEWEWERGEPYEPCSARGLSRAAPETEAGDSREAEAEAEAEAAAEAEVEAVRGVSTGGRLGECSAWCW